MSASLIVAALAGSSLLMAQLGQTQNSESAPEHPVVKASSEVLVADNRRPTKRPSVEAKNAKPDPVAKPEEAVPAVQADDAKAGKPAAAKTSPYVATAGDYTITLRKADGVARMEKSIKMDPGRLFAKGNGQMVTQSSRSGSNGQPQVTTQVTPFGNGIDRKSTRLNSSH